MFTPDPDLVDKLAPHLERVLVIDPFEGSVKVAAELLRGLGAWRVEGVMTSRQGYDLASSWSPHLIISESRAPGVDGAAFTRALRRSTLNCRQVPVIMASSSPTASEITAARDAGAHEFLRKPYSANDLKRRVQNVTGQPRPWIEAMAYVGPDRRRFNSGDYKGPQKRRSDGADAPPTAAEQVQDALKVLRSALLHAHQDPRQAERSIRAQLDSLTEVALRAQDPRLVHAVAELNGYVSTLARGEKPVKALGATFTALTSAAAEAGDALDTKAG